MTLNELKRKENEQKEANRQAALAGLGITPEMSAASRAKAEQADADRKINDARMKFVRNWVDDLQNP